MAEKIIMSLVAIDVEKWEQDDTATRAEQISVLYSSLQPW